MILRTSTLVLASLLITRTLAAGEHRVAILPVENLAGISDAQLDYLHDIIRDAAAQALSDTSYTLVPQDQVFAALQTDPAQQMHCDESCAAFVGKALGATYVVHATIKQLDRQAVIILKLLDAADGSLKSMKRIKGNYLGALEGPLVPEVKILLNLPAPALPQPTSDGIPPEFSFQLDDYWGDIVVTAQGVKEHGDDQTPRTLKADVYINGKRVGFTPYRDGLPEGKYRIEVRYDRSTPFTKTVPVVPGRRHIIEAELIIPMTDSERTEFQRQKREEERARLQQIHDAWKEEHRRWEEESKPVRNKRIAMLISGVGLGIVGFGFVISGGVFEGKAQDQHDDVLGYYENWQNSVTPEDLEYYSDKVDKYESWRDRNHALGVTYLCIGSAAFATSAALLIYLAATPRAPKEPDPPERLAGPVRPDLRISPALGPGFAGGNLSIKF